MRSIGEYKLSEVLPDLKLIAKQHNLRLHYAREFKIARMLLAIR
jgi:hypothetical protein